MRLPKPLSRSITHLLSAVVVLVWIAATGVLVTRSYLSPGLLQPAADLARYGSGAQWRDEYYKGEKIGPISLFTRC